MTISGQEKAAYPIPQARKQLPGQEKRAEQDQDQPHYRAESPPSVH